MESNVADVVSLDQRRVLTNRRAEALLGSAPTFTFEPDPGDAGLCCSVRLMRGDGEDWLGLVRDHSLFAERVRMGMKPRFVVHHDGETPVVCGDADVTLCGRARAEELALLTVGQRTVVAALLASHAFHAADLVVVAVRLGEVRVDDGDAPVHGAIPRT